MSRLRSAGACVLVCVAVFFLPLLQLSAPASDAAWSAASSSNSSGQRNSRQALEQRALRRLQAGNDFTGSTIPPKYSNLDRAAETQRIYRSVAAERNATARALQDPAAAWQRWLVAYNITYSSRTEADYRRQVWMSNLQRADKLNQLVGPEVAFGVNRFSELTPEEFLQRYTGDAQRDSGITVMPDDPQMLNSSVAPLLADFAAGTFLTPKGAAPETPVQQGSNVTNTTGGALPALTPGAPAVGGGGGIGGGGPAVPPQPGTPGGAPPGFVEPIVRPPGGGASPPPPGGSSGPGGSPTGLVTPPIVGGGGGSTVPVPPGGATTPPGGGAAITPTSPPLGSGATTPPPAPGTTPAGGAAPGSVTPAGAGTPPPPPGALPAPGGAGPLPPGVAPPIVRPAAGPGTPPPGIAIPSTPIGGGAGAPPPAAAAPGAPATSPPAGAGQPGAAPPPPGVTPGQPAGRRRQLLELQLQQLITEQLMPAAGQQEAEQQWTLPGLHQQQQQEQPGASEGHHQLGRGNWLVLKGVAAVVKQAWHAWGTLLPRHVSSSSSSSSTHVLGDSSDTAVGLTPPWQDSTGCEEDAEDTAVAEAALAAAFEDADGSSSSSEWDRTSFSGRPTRQLQQAFVMSNAACSKQVPWLFGQDQPMASVDWLRQGVVAPGLREQSNCSNSFVFVAAALAETTMALLGYSGTAKRLSEAQMMACMPDANCSRAGTVHVLLNSLACGGTAAAASGPNAFPIADPATAADTPEACRAGDFNPVETGLTGWSFVPPTELAFAQALSRTPIKVSVDAAMLQSYRAGFIGCNVRSGVANHAMLAVGYSQRVRAAPRPGSAPSGPQRELDFYTGGSYWMLRNSWGAQGSVDGYVYVAKGCGGGGVAPLGLLANRGVMPLFNASNTYGVGRLQCFFPGDTPDPGCDKGLLLRLSSFCSKVEDFLPLKARTNCSCSCVPV